MFELPDMEDVIKITVDSSTVKGLSEPIVTYGKTSTSVLNFKLLLEIITLLPY